MTSRKRHAPRRDRAEDAAMYRMAARALKAQRGKPWTYVRDARELCK